MYRLLSEIEGQNSEGTLIKIKVGTKLRKLDSKDVMAYFDRTDIRRFKILDGEHKGLHITTCLKNVEVIE